MDLFDQSVQSNKKLALPFPKICIYNPTFLSSNQSFGQNRNGSLLFDWRPCFNRTTSFHFFVIIPLVSNWLVWQWKWKVPVVSQKFIPTNTLPRFELNISWKRWILHTKFVSMVCKDFINRTVADFLDLTRAFFITSGGWFCRTSWNVLFKLGPLEEFSSLCSDNTERLDVLGQKISTGSWSGPKTEPYTSTDPIRVLIRANPLMQTLWFKTKTNRTK